MSSRLSKQKNFKLNYVNPVELISESIKYELGKQCKQNPEITFEEALDLVRDPKNMTNLTSSLSLPFSLKIETFNLAVKNVYRNISPKTPLLEFLPPKYFME